MMPSSGVLAEGSDVSSARMRGVIPGCLVEAFVAPKSAAVACEDAIAASANHIALLDGMSTPLRSGEQRASGRDFALRLADEIVELPAAINAQEAIEQLSEAVSSLRPDHAGPAGAVLAVVSLRRREVWRVGDVHVRIGSVEYHGSKEVDEALSAFRAAINCARLAEGTSIEELIRDDPGLRAAGPLLAHQPALANRVTPMGYGVLNGDFVPPDFIEVIPLGNAHEVALASDGFLSADRTLAKAQARLSRAMRRDPAALNELRSMAKPLLPGANAPDDRSYLRIRC